MKVNLADLLLLGHIIRIGFITGIIMLVGHFTGVTLLPVLSILMFVGLGVALIEISTIQAAIFVKENNLEEPLDKPNES